MIIDSFKSGVYFNEKFKIFNYARMQKIKCVFEANNGDIRMPKISFSWRKFSLRLI